MTVEEDIKAWALQRPAWQQEVLAGLARGESVGAPESIAALTDRILAPGSGEPNTAAAGIVLGGAKDKQVRLSSVCNLRGVNALADDQSLSFAINGLTIIYGNNGSGKSGYARLIKGMVSARHLAKVLPDVFTDGAPDPSAELVYQVDGDDASEKFPARDPVDDLQRVRFYDEQCGDEYLTRESTITYRPSALTLLDGLIEMCDKVRLELQRRITENEQQRLNLSVPPETVAGAFLSRLSAKTTRAEIDEATALPASAKDDLGNALQEVARLEASDAAKERARLQAAATDTKRLQDRLTELTAAISDEHVTAVETLKADAITKREAAKVAAFNTFDDEPLSGVGSQTWRVLWEAARTYATTEVDHEHEFPPTGEGARCALCQQPLDDGAKDRFERFNSYMTDTTQRDAMIAERIYMAALDELRVLDFATQQTTIALATVLVHDPGLARSVRERLGSLEERRDRLVEHFTEGQLAVSSLLESGDSAKLGTCAAALEAKAVATNVEGFQAELAKARARLGQLKASQALADAAAALSAEVTRQKELSTLVTAKPQVDTAGITRKATELTTAHATEQIRDNFTRETERMGLARVTLKDRGGQKGKVNQIPALLGARHKDARASLVLSEGEQTVLGLAGFFTEAEFDDSKSALVFDDPVTSLDHVRRDKVALRLAEFATERQVIVFTHDVAFVAELLKAAGKKGVTPATRSIQSRGSLPGIPGYCADGFPWKAQDTPQRLDTILKEIQALKKDRQTLDDDAYESRVSPVAGMLSETWERAVTSEIANKVFDRSVSQVQPKMVRILSKFTDSDNKEFQDGYGLTSKWARRHDKAEETNYVPPEPNELEAAYDLLKAWYKRIKSYQQQDPSAS